MAKLAKLSEGQIKARVGAQSFQRGKNYYRNGAIERPQIQGKTLKASCMGTSVYRLWVTLDGKGVESANCSCPVGGGGYCKHTAALLLTWLHDEGTFTVREDLRANLQKRSKEELLVIIDRFLDREPELEDLLELPIITEGSTTVEAVSPDFISAQVEKIINQGGGYDYDDYYHASNIAEELETFVDLGRQYLQKGSRQNAAVVAEAMIVTIRESYDEIYDHDGDVAVVVDSCVSLLGECLSEMDEVAEAEAHWQMVKLLFSVWEWDIELGGTDLGYESDELVMEYATSAEKARLVEQVQKKLQLLGSGEGYSRDWVRSKYGGMLLKLQEDVDDETYLRICLQSGRDLDYAERLIKLKRFGELTNVAHEVKEYDLIRIADLLKEHKRPQMGADIIWERMGTSKDRRLGAWLKQYAMETGDWSQAVKLAAEAFFERPALDEYTELIELAQKAGRKAETHQQVLEWLSTQEEYGILIEIHLHEKRPEEALETLEKYKASSPRWGVHQSLVLQVVAAVEDTHPQMGLDMYTDLALRLIKLRGRENYREAAKYLSKVKRVYTEVLGQAAEWKTLIREIRSENSSLRAMKDEFDRAGL